MKTLRCLAFTFAVFLPAAVINFATRPMSEERVALVISNNDYPNLSSDKQLNSAISDPMCATSSKYRANAVRASNLSFDLQRSPVDKHRSNEEIES